MFCIVDLHIVLDVPRLSLPELLEVLRPLEATYMSACTAFRSREPTSRFGGIQVSLGTGDMAIALSPKQADPVCTCAGDMAIALSPTDPVCTCDLVVSDGQGMPKASGDLSSILAGGGFHCQVIG